jgi:hypothetical protein
MSSLSAPDKLTIVPFESEGISHLMPWGSGKMTGCEKPSDMLSVVPFISAR